MQRCWAFLLPFAVVVSACSAGAGSGHHHSFDGGTLPDGAPSPNMCATFMDCDPGQVCRAVGGVLQCVFPDLVPDPSTCTPACAAGTECRGGVCVAPSDSGAVCEFDTECGDDLCIAGRCTPDPRGRPPCTTTGMCPGSLTCVAGACTCAHSVDCPIGAICTDGACTTPGCLADHDCPSADDVCEGTLCIPRATCDIVPPDLAGTWSLESTLRLRESLPSWLDTLLSLVSGPFRFIAGDSTTLGLGLPSTIESIIAPAMRDWADSHLAPWARELLGAIADLNDILSTWSVDERMELMRPGPSLDTYTGTHEWLRVRFTYMGSPVEGRPEDIIGWEFTPSEFDANVVCGEFLIQRHDVHVSISSIVAWAVNLVTYEATGHRYATLHDALTAVTAGFCSALADAAQSAVGSSYSVRGVVDSACNTAVSSLIDSVTMTIDGATIGADVMTLKGHAPIAGPNRMSPGVWEGTLAGRDFTGDFDASR